LSKIKVVQFTCSVLRAKTSAVKSLGRQATGRTKSTPENLFSFSPNNLPRKRTMNGNLRNSFGHIGFLGVRLLAFFALLAFSGSLSLESASATGFITPGSPRASNGGTAGVAAGTQFRVYLESGRSYSCTVLPSDSTTTVALSTTVTGPNADITAVARGDYTPVVTAPTTTAAAPMRLSLRPLDSGLHTFTVSTATDTEIVRPECIETTLYGGYNTNVSTFNFLEISNISNKDLKVRINAKNFDGSTVINDGASSARTIPAGQRVDVDIHTPAGSGVFGSLVITHDGPYGAIQASLSQYTGTVSDFDLTVSEALRPRDQKF
jgi:hypothetical protein